MDNYTYKVVKDVSLRFETGFANTQTQIAIFSTLDEAFDYSEKLTGENMDNNIEYYVVSIRKIVS